MEQKKVHIWSELEEESEEMDKLNSLLFCMSMATLVEESKSTFSLSKLSPALFLAQDLLKDIQGKINDLSRIDRMEYISSNNL